MTLTPPAALLAAFGAEAWEPWARVTFTDGGTTFDVRSWSPDVVDGVYSASRTRWPRQELDLVLPAAVVPGEEGRPVSPFGGSCVLEVGAYVAGQLLTFPVATLDVTEVTVQRPDGTINVRATSREARLNESRDVVTPLGGSLYTTSQAVQELLYAHWSGSPVPRLTSTLSNDRLIVEDLDASYLGAWEVIEELMDLCDGVAYFDAAGDLVLEDEPVKGTPDTTLTTGDGGTLLAYRSQRRWAPNRCFMVYDNGTSQRVGSWVNSVTGSPATWGEYGFRTTVEFRNVSGTLPTLAAADRAARAIGRRRGAAMRRVELQTIPAPWLEPGDTVGVELLGETSETHLVEGVRWSLGQLEPMDVICQDDAYTEP